MGQTFTHTDVLQLIPKDQSRALRQCWVHTDMNKGAHSLSFGALYGSGRDWGACRTSPSPSSTNISSGFMRSFGTPTEVGAADHVLLLPRLSRIGFGVCIGRLTLKGYRVGIELVSRRSEQSVWRQFAVHTMRIQYLLLNQKRWYLRAP